MPNSAGPGLTLPQLKPWDSRFSEGWLVDHSPISASFGISLERAHVYTGENETIELDNGTTVEAPVYERVWESVNNTGRRVQEKARMLQERGFFRESFYK